MSEPRTIVYAGGGTGGHLFPGLAVADHVAKHRPELRQVFLIGWRRTELDILGRYGYEHFAMDTPQMPQRVRELHPFIWRFARAYRRSKRYLAENNVAAVVGLGGYGSVPMVLVARRRVPVVLLEQNTIPGKANRWLSRWADVVVTSFEETAGYFGRRVRVQHLGNPVREGIAAGNRAEGRIRLGLSPERPTVLVWGGSLGAHAVNTAVTGNLERLKELSSRIQVVHQTGRDDENAVRAVYVQAGMQAHVAGFMDAPTAYAAADVFVGRAGATTLAEVCLAGLPAVLIPYPLAAADHQMKNARALERAGAALVIDQSELTPERLWDTVVGLLVDDVARQQAAEAARRLGRPHAAADVAELVLAKVGNGPGR